MEAHMRKKIEDQHKAPLLDPNSFGNIAIGLNYITYDDLLEALTKQEKRSPIGEILMNMGKLTKWQRDEILLIQESRKARSTEDKTKVEIRRQKNIIRTLSSYMESVKAETSLFITDIDPTVNNSCSGKK